MHDIKKVKECPECASNNLNYVESKEQVVCKDCGNIFEPAPKEKRKKIVTNQQ